MSENLASTTLVVFGVSGDLSRRYLLPALSEICRNSAIRANLRILGISRREISPKDVLTNETANLTDHFKTLTMDYHQPDEYQKLKDELNDIGSDQIIFYFAVPPGAVQTIVKQLGNYKLNTSKFRLLMEKPFGSDLQSAKALVDQTQRSFKEEQVYRIDHYLAKEMAQNISIFLGSNALFRNVWNNQFIDSIEIISAERIGIEGRVNFYESTGAVRDIIQSHLMNLAALTLMRPCSSFYEFEEMPERRLEALAQLLPADPGKAVRSQYKGYREEVNNPRSVTETFAAVTLYSGDPRWQGVPIHLATGKNLNTKTTEIRANFKKAEESQANTLTLKIQPQEGVEIDLWAKKPGFDQALRHLPLTFSYAGEECLPDAYERVLLDAIRSSSSLFVGSQEVLETWRVLQPILTSWSKDTKDLKIYEPGSTVEQVIDLQKDS